MCYYLLIAVFAALKLIYELKLYKLFNLGHFTLSI